jgi:hypothetical protein
MSSGAVAEALPQRAFEARRFPGQPAPDSIASARRAPIAAPVAGHRGLVTDLAEAMLCAIWDEPWQPARGIWGTSAAVPDAARGPKGGYSAKAVQSQGSSSSRVLLSPAVPVLLVLTVRVAMIAVDLEFSEASNCARDARPTSPRDQQMLPFAENDRVEMLPPAAHSAPPEDLAASALGATQNFAARGSAW